MANIIKDLFDKAFLGGEWSVALKRKDEEIYLVQNEGHKDYWIADPFLYKRGGKCYLFCEKYLRRKSKGVIGVFEINDDLSLNDLGVAIDEPYHISYPHVFEIGNYLYMIPESSGARTIDLYICDSFPLKWRKIKTLENDLYAVDSNTFIKEGQRFLITYVYQNRVPFLQVYVFDDVNLALELVCVHEYDDNVGRGAGNIFFEDGVAIRPTQNQKMKYGESLLFNEMQFSGNVYCENIRHELKVDDIKSNGRKRYKRIHTYNSLDELEVVDIRSEEYKPFLIFEKLKRRLYNKGR